MQYIFMAIFSTFFYNIDEPSPCVTKINPTIYKNTNLQEEFMEDLNVAIKLVNQKVQFKAVSETNPERPVMMVMFRLSAMVRGTWGLSFCL